MYDLELGDVFKVVEPLLVTDASDGPWGKCIGCYRATGEPYSHDGVWSVQCEPCHDKTIPTLLYRGLEC